MTTPSPNYSDFSFDETIATTLDYDITLTASTGAPLTPSQITELWFTGKINDTLPDNQALFQITFTGGGITTVDGPNGKYHITVPASASTGITNPKTYLTDLKVKLVAAATIKPLLKGRINFYKGITLAIV
jgi:hypothetical protein